MCAIALAALAAAPLSAVAEGNGARGCAKAPGAPEEAAILQYCPSKGKGIEKPREATAETPAGPAADGGPSGGDGPKTGPANEPTRLPLLDYPASDAVAAVFWILLAVLAVLAGRYAYRRWIAQRIGGGGGNRLSTPKAGRE